MLSEYVAGTGESGSYETEAVGYDRTLTLYRKGQNSALRGTLRVVAHRVASSPRLLRDVLG